MSSAEDQVIAPQPEVIEAKPAAVEVELPVQDVEVILPAWEWSRVQLDVSQWQQARQQVRKSLKEGRLLDGDNAALPQLLAMRELKPKDRWVAGQIRQIRDRLGGEFDQLLLAPERQRRALVSARQRLSVLQVISDGEDLNTRHQALVTAQQILALNRRGEAALREGRLGIDGAGALADFRSVLALAPDNARALQGVAAVESAALRRALNHARLGEFMQSDRWINKASSVREDDVVRRVVKQRIELERDVQVETLFRQAQQDIRRAPGLKAGNEKLERMRKVALPGDRRLTRLEARIELATRYGNFAPAQALRDGLRDGGYGPQMIVIPAGTYVMGAEDGEPGASESERPAHKVRFDRGFAIAATELTVGQFRRFVESTRGRPRATRRGHSVVYEPRTGNFIRRSGVDWQHGYEGRAAADDRPVMHVSVRDAEAYAAWLSDQTGQFYRLPSEAEFEYVLRAGSQGRYPWGNASTPPDRVGNLTGSDDVSSTGRQWNNAFPGYGDGWWGVAPVGLFEPNAFGVYDMEGNLSEWVGDCWHASYRRAPADGATWYNPGCRQRVVRGANWANAPVQARAAWRWQQESDVTSARIGFRVVRGL